MTPTLSLTESQTCTALRAFLLNVLPSPVEVIRTQDNRVPVPSGPDYVTMTPMMLVRLETNVVTYGDPFPATPGTRMDRKATQVTVQLDIYGPASADNAQIVATLLRSDYATDQFATSGFDVTPLYAGEPHQMPFSNGEQQVENRWTVDAVLQTNPIVTTGQEFASEVHIGTQGLINVDVVYPP